MSKADIDFRTAIHTAEGREIFAVRAGQLVQAHIMEDAIVSHVMPIATVDSEHLPKVGYVRHGHRRHRSHHQGACQVRQGWGG